MMNGKGMGNTYVKDLSQVFKLSKQEDLEKRKARLFPNENTDNETLTSNLLAFGG